jgi:undecaprenyl diphosphate synthase
MREFKRVPAHLGIIPDGNRRWASARGLSKADGYWHGIEPAKRMFEAVWDLGIQEVSTYVFTQENTHRPREQIEAFKGAFLEFLEWVQGRDVSLLVVGDTTSRMFPRELASLTVPEDDRASRRRLNLLVNYSWRWDVGEVGKAPLPSGRGVVLGSIGSRHVSRIDLIVRWGGRNRLSGFLPLQSAYADIYKVDALWPDATVDELHGALEWYGWQDVTLGG